jgi:diguanylate cyclase (GGDEF)-like protein/PAS domain S-box-containing protein
MEDAPKTLAASLSSGDESFVEVKTSDGPALSADPVLYRLIVDSLTEYAVFAVSPNGIVISWYAGAEKTFGYTAAEILGRPFDVFFTADDLQIRAPQDELASALSGEQTQHDRWHMRKDRTRFWGTNTVQPIYDTAGVLVGFTKLVRDNTINHLALEELSDSEQQLRLLVESVHGYAIFSIELNGTIKSWNAGGEKVFGYTPRDIIGCNFAVLFSADDVIAGVPLEELRKATICGSVDVERWMMRKDGSHFLASGKINQLKRDPAGDLRGFVKIAHDITKQHVAVQHLRHQAHYDELTELPNRRMFYHGVAQAIAAMKRRHPPLFAVLFIDIDHFKSVNDDFGHIIADQLLAAIARRLESCVCSADDIVARLGGDEFAILLNGIRGVPDASEAADRIAIEMRKSLTIGGREVGATASVGIAIASREHVQPEDILREADAAMYMAKQEGGARSVLFNSSMVTDACVNADLGADLLHAIDRNELRIVYQPIMRLIDLTVVGFEALVRWQHPRRELLPPIDFIQKAEESDLILWIDRWMISQACHQLVNWQAQGIGAESQMSVNLSSKEFLGDDFLGDLRVILEASGLSARHLRLEITESAMMERSERANTLFAAIRTLGVAIDVDDFGTGYSSLAILQYMSFDALKISSSFVANMFSTNGAKLVATVIRLAHDLGLVAIAEGIETAEQLAGLVALDCDLGQGFIFAPALSANAAGRFAADGAYGPIAGSKLMLC